MCAYFCLSKIFSFSKTIIIIWQVIKYFVSNRRKICVTCCNNWELFIKINNSKACFTFYKCLYGNYAYIAYKQTVKNVRIVKTDNRFLFLLIFILNLTLEKLINIYKIDKSNKYFPTLRFSSIQINNLIKHQRF